MKMKLILALSVLGFPTLSASQTLPAGYYHTDGSCFNWTGPNGLVYNLKWVGRSKFIGCDGDVEVFTDIFHQNSVDLSGTGDYTGVGWSYGPAPADW